MSNVNLKRSLQLFGYPEQLREETGSEYALFKIFLEQGSVPKTHKYTQNPECPDLVSGDGWTFGAIRTISENNQWQERKKAYHAKVAQQTALLEAETMDPAILEYGLKRQDNARQLLTSAEKLNQIILARLGDIYETNVVTKDTQSPDFLPAADLVRLFDLSIKALRESAKEYSDALGIEELRATVAEAIKISKKPSLASQNQEV
jgi:hypothetical protein